VLIFARYRRPRRIDLAPENLTRADRQRLKEIGVVLSGQANWYWPRRKSPAT
jgi:hypothetical protein